MPTLPLDAIKALVGQEPIVSDWMLIDQDRIDRFADVTEDRQFIHIDTVRAADTPFGGTIAHGLLILSVLPAFAEQVLPVPAEARMTVNYGYNRIRFLTMVRSGKRIRASFAVRDYNETKPDHWQMVVDVSVEIEGEAKPALIAEWIGINIL